MRKEGCDVQRKTLVLHDNNEVMLVTGATDTQQKWTALIMPKEMKGGVKC